MALISAPIATAGLSALFLAITLSAQTDDAAASSNQVSKVRIVRLSEVRGAVLLDRNNGRGFEAATANLPIVEGSRLQTGTGVAEIEFEDNSTLRLAPDSVVEFPQLERLQAGSTVTSVQLVKGMAYVSLLKTRGNEFNLLFGQQKLQLPPASRIRLEVGGAEAKLAVLDGTLHLNGASGTMDVPKKKTVTFNMAGQAEPKVAKDIASAPYDSWDQESTGYHARTGAMGALSSSPYSYGLNDMGYYGSFITAGGCGSMWRPYFASAAWDPYSNGSWAWYSGAGYSWVSPYPWGWTPYHYGSWSYCSGAGWGWQPGGSWNGLNNMVALGARNGPGTAPLRPVSPPRVGEPTMLAVNLRPLVHSEAASPESFVFRKDSAGLGVPRDSLGKLDKLSQQALGRGTASVAIYQSAPPTAAANGRSASGATAPTAIHRGSPPPSETATQMPGQSGSYASRSASPAGPSQAPASSRPR
jgi:hypothetical protein